MMRIVATISLTFLSFVCLAKDEPRYPVSAIPEELKVGACAVIREDGMKFTIHTKSTAALHTRMVVTIFNDKGKDFARQIVFYDKLRKITSFKAQVYDANGQLIKRLKPNEMTDQSAVSGLYDDSRVKIADLAQPRYPYTVEFDYEVAYRFLYIIDGSVIDAYEDVSVQHASYQLIFPESLKPRYKAHNVAKEPGTEKKDGIVTLTWTFDNIKARKFEPHSDRWQNITRIEAAPTVFEFEGYAGTMESWDAYGQWIASLNKGRNVLPEQTRQKVSQLTDGLPGREEKVKALYEYLQNKTRYVSIQLGIGGFQPFEASVVDKTGYGDCKALSNYMLALLETAGIKGHYALIRAGDDRRDLETDFPSSQFNHAIVAVPNGADTLWLECTSQTNPFGYQGGFTGDRKALLITDSGAKVVRTLRYPTEVNVQSTVADVKVMPTGQASATFKRVYAGLQYENGDLNHYLTFDHDQQKRWVERNIDIPSFALRSFSIQNIKEKLPSAIVTADVQLDRFATVSGKRLFLMPNLMNRNKHIPEQFQDRKTDIVAKVGFMDVDTIRFQLPEDIYPEFLPEDISISSRFGEYSANFRVEQGNLVYTRKLKVNKGEFPAASYEEMIDFYRNISKADHIKMVFMTKT